MGAQGQPWVWGRAKTMNADPIPQLDAETIRRQTIFRDAQELSTLNLALQADLQQLQKGVLPKDLAPDLKKVEKLSKNPAGSHSLNRFFKIVTMPFASFSAAYPKRKGGLEIRDRRQIPLARVEVETP